jgi:hypothetical protein
MNFAPVRLLRWAEGRGVNPRTSLSVERDSAS